MSGETCSVCNWTNTECLNLGDVGKPKWMCHGCIKRAVDSLQSHNENHYQEACKLRERLTSYEKQWTDMDYTIGHLRQDNERLRGEVESLNDLLKTHKVIENFKSFEKCAKELQAHKSALEKARVALDLFVTTWKLAHPMQRLLVFEECAKDCSEALSEINTLVPIKTP